VTRVTEPRRAQMPRCRNADHSNIPKQVQLPWLVSTVLFRSDCSAAQQYLIQQNAPETSYFPLYEMDNCLQVGCALAFFWASCQSVEIRGFRAVLVKVIR